MALTLGQAAKKCGLSKPTISAAIKAGRLAATQGDDGVYAIDSAELTRFMQSRMKPKIVDDKPSIETELAVLKVKLEAAEQTIADLRMDKEEARITLSKVTALIEDKRPKRRSWWPFTSFHPD
jgi:hypothetical protein